jgi:hypothetical protein
MPSLSSLLLPLALLASLACVQGKLLASASQTRPFTRCGRSLARPLAPPGADSLRGSKVTLPFHTVQDLELQQPKDYSAVQA